MDPLPTRQPITMASRILAWLWSLQIQCSRMAGTKRQKSDHLLLVIVSGLALGGLYGMTALVYNGMYSTSKVLSFGTGQFAMVGGICTAWLVLDLHWPLWIGFLACLASGAAFGWLGEGVGGRPSGAAPGQ